MDAIALLLLPVALIAFMSFLGLIAERVKRTNREWDLQLEALELKHEAERLALNTYGEAVRKWMDGKITKEDADAAYRHYMEISHPRKTS